MEYSSEKRIGVADIVHGRRIVDLGHVLQQYSAILWHKLKCTGGEMQIVKETRKGLVSFLHFYCDNCEQTVVLSSDRHGDELNEALVWGCLSTGIGHHQCEELMGVMNVPIMSAKTFAKKTSLIKNVIFSLSLSMH